MFLTGGGREFVNHLHQLIRGAEPFARNSLRRKPLMKRLLQRSASRYGFEQYELVGAMHLHVTQAATNV